MTLEQARLVLLIEVIGKGRIHLRTGHEGREGKLRFSLASALYGAWVVKATSWPLYPLERDRVPILQEACGGPQGRYV